MRLPKDDEIEITIFGKGIGECLLVHVGSMKWIIVDSFTTSTGTPVVAEYLASMGVEIAECIKYLVVSHWHDDHIKGMSHLVRQCPSARFCCSSAFTKQEFLDLVQSFGSRNNVSAGSGVSEIKDTYEYLMKNRIRPKLAIADRKILNIEAHDLAHGKDCDVWSLSPSDLQCLEFLKDVGKMLPTKGETKRRATPNKENNTSVVLQITWENESVLLGADLEETAHIDSGWSAIVSSDARPKIRSSVFKVPHHGSSNGHHQPVWDEMLIENVQAAVTPYNAGSKKLPSPADIYRLLNSTDNAYLAGRSSKISAIGKNSTVSKIIKDVTKEYHEYSQDYGYVQFRKKIGSAGSWSVFKSPLASHLEDL